MCQLKSQGFTTTDWLTGRLTPEEVEETVQQIALLHAAGLAYRLVPNSVGWWLLRRLLLLQISSNQRH